MERKKIIIYEAMGVVFIIIFIWLDEIIDLPHILLGAPKTPINFTESIVESFIVFILAALTLSITNRLLKRIKYLEGFLCICCAFVQVKTGVRPAMCAYGESADGFSII